MAQIEIRTIMTELADAGKTVIFSSHRLSDVERVSARLVLLSHGRTTRSGKLDELIESAGFDVRVADAAEGAKVLRAAGSQKAEDRGEGWLFVSTEASQPASQILGVLGSSGVEVLEFRPHRGSLEDLFVSSVLDGEVSDA